MARSGESPVPILVLGGRVSYFSRHRGRALRLPPLSGVKAGKNGFSLVFRGDPQELVLTSQLS